jgi:hypothetical protein
VTKEDPGGIVGAAHICKAPQRILRWVASGACDHESQVSVFGVETVSNIVIKN